MHRRDFNLGLLKLSAAALVSPRLFAQPLDSATDTASIAALYKSAIVIDSLCSPHRPGAANQGRRPCRRSPIRNYRCQLHGFAIDVRRYSR